MSTPTRLRLLDTKPGLPLIIIRDKTYASNRWKAMCCACQAKIKPATGVLAAVVYETPGVIFQTVCRGCGEKWVDGSDSVKNVS